MRIGYRVPEEILRISKLQERPMTPTPDAFFAELSP
jgi:hypothetical protein